MKKSKWVSALFLMIGFVLFSSFLARAEPEVFIESGYGLFTPEKSSYLGTQIGAGPNVFNYVRTGDDARIFSTSLGVKHAVSDNWSMFGGLERARATAQESFRLDPNGTNLLIPGVGVGPSGGGFFLPAATNQVTNGHYSSEHDYFKVNYGVERDFKTRFKRLNVKPAIGIEYSQSITSNDFTGDLPLFFRRFAYYTKTKVKTVSPIIGVDMSYRLTPKVKFLGSAQAAYNFNNGSGRDSLRFTGFADQTANMNNNKDTQTYGLKAGFSIQPTPKTEITIQGNYNRIGNVPIMNVRDGASVSDFSYRSADVYTGTIRASYKF